MKTKRILLIALVVCFAVTWTLFRHFKTSPEKQSSATPIAAVAPAAAPLQPAPPIPAPAQQVTATTTDTAFNAFREWQPRFEAARALGAVPADLIEEGRQLAAAREPAMLQLIRENPARALGQSLKWNEWMALPQDIRALVEQPFSATAELSVTPDCRAPNARQTPWQTHRVGMNGEYFDAFVYGHREWMPAKSLTSLQGIRLQHLMALWDSAVLPLNAQELAAVQTVLPDGNDRTRSWLTGQAINGEPAAALIGGKIHYFADAIEQQEVASAIAEAESMPGPRTVVEAMAMATSGFGGVFDTKAFANAAKQMKSVWTETPKRILSMRVDFTPASGGIYSSNDLAAVFFDASNTLRTMSFNKTWVSNTIVPVLLTITNNQNYWETNTTGANGIMETAKGMAAAMGYVLANYDIYTIAMPYMQRHAGAAAFAGGQHLWFNGGPHGAVVATHELGHNYGYIHANYWRGNTGAGLLGHANGTGGVLEHEEYGDPFDIMGEAYSVYPGGHFCAQAKAYLNWIEPTEVVNVTTSGVYRVRRFDHINSRLLAGTKLALQIRSSVGDTFWVAYRQTLTNGNYSALMTGAYVTWANAVNAHRLIDTTRLSVPNGGPVQEKYDAPLQPGKSWVDPSGTVRITTLGTGGASPNEYLDIDVQLINEPPYQLFTTSARTTNGLIGSYVNSSLRSYAPQDDWRTSQTISGTRRDATINFTSDGWGVRSLVGVTGGSDGDWENFSVQWDGWLQVNRATRFATRTDDGSRMWIDLNGNAAFGATSPEFINNNWGNGQGATLGEISAVVPPGLYRIRIQYEEEVGGNYCELVASQMEFDLFTDAALTTNGLTGSYVNTSLRSYAAQDDWRTSQTISGTRRDIYPLFLDNAFAEGPWGNRTNVGITGGSNADWDNYSVQWDGWIRLNQAMRFATLSDDGSRMWIDVNGNGSFATTAPEFINNHWGAGQGDTYGDTSATIAAGTYRIRIQYEEGAGGNHFALYGAPQETPGINGYALSLDGVDDFMVVSNVGTSLPTGEVTVEFWQRAYEQRNQFAFILSPDNTANRFSAAMPWADGNTYWDFGPIASNGRLVYTPTPSIVGTWQHWALVSSVTGAFQRVYRNGVLEANDANASAYAQVAGHLVLGGRAGEALKGELDEFRIWSVVRTGLEIQQNMRCRIPGPQSGLWAYWRFDEGVNTTVADQSGNGRHGTLINGAQWAISTIPELQTTFTNVVTTLADGGPGSLRTIITNVNACDCSSVITFAVNGTINLSSPLPVITSSATVLGPGTNNLAISGGGNHAIFAFAANTTNRVSGLRLVNASSVNAGAALRNAGRTVLENCIISNSVTAQSFGGAVANIFQPTASLFVSNCVFVNNRIRGGDGENRGPGNNGGPGGGGAGMGGAIYTEGASLTISSSAFIGNVAAGGNGGNGDGNSGSNDTGGNGGFPNRGIGGAAGQPGGGGGFGGGGGGGAGSGGTGYAGGAGGFGGGGGAGGARGFGGDGGAPGAGGQHGGAAGPSFASHSGGGGGGAGLGGAIFARTGVVTVVNCSFTGNIATNGIGGVGSFGGGNGANGQGVGGAIFIDAGALFFPSGVSYSGNIATTEEPGVEISTLVTTLADAGFGSLRQAISNAAVQPGPSVVTFAPNLSGGVIRLTSTQLELADASGPVTITAANLPQGIGLSGENARRVFRIAAGSTVVLDSLTISNGLGTVGAFPGNGGGGVYSEGLLTVNRCTFTRNTVPSQAGNISIGGGLASYRGLLNISNSTFAQNSIQAGTTAYGGGVVSTFSTNVFHHCTVASNTATGSGANGGGILIDNGNLQLSHTLVAANVGSTTPDLSGLGIAIITSLGHNLLGNGSGSPLVHGVNGDQVGSAATPINPRLGPLGLNGGKTPTYAPMGGSPAVDAGDPLLSGLGLSDQRGFARVANGRVDVGAVEIGVRVYYNFDAISAVDMFGGSVATYQNSGQWWNSDHRGQVSSAIALNDPGFGTNNYYVITSPHDPTNANRGLGLKGDFTVSMWIYPRVQGGWKVMLANNGPGTSGNLVLGLFNQNVRFAFWDNDINGSRVVPLNQWTHVACTYNSHGGQMALYINGLLDVSAVGRGNTLGNHNLLLGFCSAIANSYFQGFIDEFAIYAEALSPSQISALAAPAGIFPHTVLPQPVLSPGLATPACGWNVREIYAHTNDPAVMPYDLPSAEHVANTPLSASATNYNSSVINRRDPDTNGGDTGFRGGDLPFASNNRTPQGLINTDDNFFVLAAQATIQIAVEDDYTFGFATDDGARIRIKGAAFSSSTRLDPVNPANPAHRGDTLTHPDNSGNSQTLGVAHLKPGSYEVEFITWERDGGAFAEVIAARGAKTSVDSSFALLSPLLFTTNRPSVSITRVPPSLNVRLNWSGSSCYRLQSANNILGPWSDVVNGTNGIVITPGAAAQFYRLLE